MLNGKTAFAIETVNVHSPWPLVTFRMTYHHFFRQLAYDIFCASLGVYALSLVVEVVKKGSILTVVDLNLVLIVTVASGAVSMFFPVHRAVKSYGLFEYVLIALVAIALAMTVYRATENSGMLWALLLAFGAGNMVVVIPLLARPTQNDNKE